MITTLLATGLAIALAVLAASVTALLIDGRRVTRLERALAAANHTIEVADRTVGQLIAERDEARRSLRDALNIQRDAYVRLRPGGTIRSYPQIVGGVPEVEQEPRCPSCGSLGNEAGLRLANCTDRFHHDEPTRDFTRIVERNNWPKWPNQ